MTEEIERLKDIICLADELLMDAWGAYPLPGNPNREKMWLIRDISGEDFYERKERALRALGQ